MPFCQISQEVKFTLQFSPIFLMLHFDEVEEVVEAFVRQSLGSRAVGLDAKQAVL